VNLVERISPQYLLSVRDIYGDLFVYGGIASTFTSVRGGAFNISGFSTFPIRYTRFSNVLLCINYIMVA
jgi:hypothetical protein